MYDDDLTPEQKFNSEDPEILVPRELYRGRSREEVIAEVVKLDWSPAAAEKLVDRVIADMYRFQKASPKSRKKLLQETQRQIISGITLTVLGIKIAILDLFELLFTDYSLFLAGCGICVAGIILISQGFRRRQVFQTVSSHSWPTDGEWQRADHDQ